MEKALFSLFLYKCPILIFFSFRSSSIIHFLSFSISFFPRVLVSYFLVPLPSIPPEFADTLLQGKGQKNYRVFEKTISKKWEKMAKGNIVYSWKLFVLFVSIFIRWELTPIFSTEFRIVQTISLFKVSND